MARRRTAATAAAVTSDDAEIVGWYEDQLSRSAPPTDLDWEPDRIGPTWQWDNGWHLPTLTLGWNVLAWSGRSLHGKNGHEWVYTLEQARFLLWFYALDEHGDFLFHSAVLQRLKGWGKDPLAACVSVNECFADVRFDHWRNGLPVGRDEPNAWVQIVAVAQDQTKNTFKLFPSLIPLHTRRRYGIQVQKRNVWGLGDTRQIEAVTNSPLAIEGGRPTLTVRAETQNWVTGNGGHEMAGAMEGNAAKSEGGAARMLDICNAYRPGRDSVGQRQREAWEQTQGDNAIADFGVLYDSLEAPGEAPLTAEDAPAVVRSIAGDAVWLDTKPRGRIVKSILNPANPPSESRRKWYNQISAAEESWADPLQWDTLKQPDWRVEPRSEIVMFLDASKSDDATALIAVRVSDGHVFVLKIWQRPPQANSRSKRGDGISPPPWQVNRDDVDHEVGEAFERYRVVGFWVDPSDARDDETGARYWEPLCDAWAERYGRKLKLKAVRTGASKHSIIWDMRSRVHTRQFTEHAGQVVTEIDDGELTHDGDERLKQHVRNARRAPNEYGVSLAKEHRESNRKVDGAVAMVGARLMWRFYRAQQAEAAAKKKPAMNQQKVVVMHGRRGGAGRVGPAQRVPPRRR